MNLLKLLFVFIAHINEVTHIALLEGSEHGGRALGLFQSLGDA